MSQRHTDENQIQPTHQHPGLLGLWPGRREGRRGEEEGGAGAGPGRSRGSRARAARQQTQFTKRHLFHYSNALWLITSWPVCEMTATYSPVNRKICTCSIWGVGEQRRRGGRGRGGGVQPRGKRKGRGHLGERSLWGEPSTGQVEGQDQNVGALRSRGEPAAVAFRPT